MGEWRPRRAGRIDPSLPAMTSNSRSRLTHCAASSSTGSRTISVLSASPRQAQHQRGRKRPGLAGQVRHRPYHDPRLLAHLSRPDRGFHRLARLDKARKAVRTSPPASAGDRPSRNRIAMSDQHDDDRVRAREMPRPAGPAGALPAPFRHPPTSPRTARRTRGWPCQPKTALAVAASSRIDRRQWVITARNSANRASPPGLRMALLRRVEKPAQRALVQRLGLPFADLDGEERSLRPPPEEHRRIVGRGRRPDGRAAPSAAPPHAQRRLALHHHLAAPQHQRARRSIPPTAAPEPPPRAAPPHGPVPPLRMSPVPRPAWAFRRTDFTAWQSHFPLHPEMLARRLRRGTRLRNPACATRKQRDWTPEGSATARAAHPRERRTCMPSFWPMTIMPTPPPPGTGLGRGRDADPPPAR